MPKHPAATRRGFTNPRKTWRGDTLMEGEHTFGKLVKTDKTWFATYSRFASAGAAGFTSKLKARKWLRAQLRRISGS